MPQLPPPPEGWALMQSCRANERAIESRKLGHGVFTHFLIKRLSGDADLAPKGESGDGVVTMSELASYVGSNTSSFVRSNHRPFTQSPEVEGRYDTNTPLVKVVESLEDDLKGLLDTIARTSGTPEYTKKMAPTRAKIWFEAAKNGRRGNPSRRGMPRVRHRRKPKDFKIAYEKYKAAADMGLPLAMDYVAYCHREGLGVDKNIDEARRWYEKRWKNGVPGRTSRWGRCTCTETGGDRHRERHRPSAKGGGRRPVVRLGGAGGSRIGGTRIEAEQDRRRRQVSQGGGSRKRGCPKLVGGVSPRRERDSGRQRRSVEMVPDERFARNASGQDNVGYCHAYGLGTDEDKKEAARWFRKAADQGFAMSQLRLGEMFERGEGVRKDPAEAFKWYVKSAENGNMRAAHNLAVCYETGTGTTANDKEAFAWYTKSAEGGRTRSNKLGNCHFNGYGTAQDDAEAVRWYRASSEQGYATATGNLAFMYLQGRGWTRTLWNRSDCSGSPPTKGTSIRWLRRAGAAATETVSARTRTKR